MSHPMLLRDGGDHRRLRQTSARLSVAGRPAPHSMLARYLEGWAEADPAKIADATAHHYEFYDPLVGHFSRRTLPQYFALLRSRFAIVGTEAARDLAFTLRGPMTSASDASRRQYWREAPLLGLTGLAEITMRHGRVVAEEVAYDLNMACEALRGNGLNRVGADPACVLQVSEELPSASAARVEAGRRFALEQPAAF